jgi:hypothetical protein
MPRIPRGQVSGHVYHVLNRGNGGAIVFHKDADHVAFLTLLAMAKSNIRSASLASVSCRIMFISCFNLQPRTYSVLACNDG